MQFGGQIEANPHISMDMLQGLARSKTLTAPHMQLVIYTGWAMEVHAREHASGGFGKHAKCVQVYHNSQRHEQASKCGQSSTKVKAW